MTDTDVAGIATRLVDLEERRDILNAQIKGLRAQLVDAVEVGGVVAVGDIDVYRVAPGRRTFSAELAAEKLPPEVLSATTVATVNGAAVKRLSPALWEACCTVGEPYLTAVR